MAKRVGPDRAHRLNQFGELRAACQRRRRNIRKNRGGVIAPGNRIGCDVPHEGRLAERGKDGRSLRNGGCQNRLVSGHRRVIPGPRILPASALTLGKVHEYSAKPRFCRPGAERGEPAWLLRWACGKRGATSQNVTVQPDFDQAMSSSGRPQQTLDEGAPPDAAPASVALVPTVASAQRSQASIRPLSRPSSIFVTHLIATAAQAPQTRSLRRATPADAQTAYQANRRPVIDAGFRTRQII